MLYTFYFPKDYKHGIVSNFEYHKSNIEMDDKYMLLRAQESLNLMFRKTELYSVLGYLGYEPYVKWDEVFINVFVARSLIVVKHGTKTLHYFHNPTYKEVYDDMKCLEACPDAFQAL